MFWLRPCEKSGEFSILPNKISIMQIYLIYINSAKSKQDLAEFLFLCLSALSGPFCAFWAFLRFLGLSALSALSVPFCSFWAFLLFLRLSALSAPFCSFCAFLRFLGLSALSALSTLSVNLPLFLPRYRLGE